jgi:DNA-binding GntR family transcriptional regulator
LDVDARRPAPNAENDRLSTVGPSTRPRNLVRLSSGEQAARFIRELIFDGELRPGARIAQDEMSKVLGVSRIPLREGLIALEREGWITLEMHRGAFVNALDEQTVRDHYELFGVLYGFAAEKAAARSGPELVRRLTELERELKAVDDPLTAGAIVFAFHREVIDAARSDRLGVLFRAMSTIVPGEFLVHVPKALQVERKMLPQIRRGITTGRPRPPAMSYTARIADEVVAVMRARGLFTLDGPGAR